MSTRTRALRRHWANSNMRRRLKEDRNQHYSNLCCPCWTDAKAMARFREQPKLCGGPCCGNPRRWFGDVTIQEHRAPMIAEAWTE